MIASNEHNETPAGKIYAAIPAIIASVGTVGKNSTNAQQGYKYRSADDICAALHDALGEQKVFTTCRMLERTEAEKTSKNGGVLFYVKLKTAYTFHAEDGSSVTTEAYGTGMDSGDKAENKAMTAAYKYALLQVFCLMGHEDSEKDSPEVAPRRRRSDEQQRPSGGATPSPAMRPDRDYLKEYKTILKNVGCLTAEDGAYVIGLATDGRRSAVDGNPVIAKEVVLGLEKPGAQEAAKLALQAMRAAPKECTDHPDMAMAATDGP